MKKILLPAAAAILLLTGCSTQSGTAEDFLELLDTVSESSREIRPSDAAPGEEPESFALEEIPEYSGEPYVVLDENEPDFTEQELTEEAFESYSELDDEGRCGEACASVGQELMPTEERQSISEVKPSGWHSVRYDFVDGESLYNRCHLIGYQLTAENANPENLITGTRYMNTEGMLPFENMVAEYVKETGNHVMYRVTPVFEEDNLVASGVEMEAESVEDDGEGVLFHVYCYNVQPGVEIDYATGESREAELPAAAEGETADYVVNTSSRKFHRPDCPGAEDMSEKNRKEFTGTREELLMKGYEPCGQCDP